MAKNRRFQKSYENGLFPEELPCIQMKQGNGLSGAYLLSIVCYH